MRTLLLIISAFFIVACEDPDSYTVSGDANDRGTCDDSIRMPICLQDGSRCTSECGTKLGDVFCYYTTDNRIVAMTLSSGKYPSNEESCDIIFENVYEWSKYKVETYGH